MGEGGECHERKEGLSMIFVSLSYGCARISSVEGLEGIDRLRAVSLFKAFNIKSVKQRNKGYTLGYEIDFSHYKFSYDLFTQYLESPYIVLYVLKSGSVGLTQVVLRSRTHMRPPYWSIPLSKQRCR